MTLRSVILADSPTNYWEFAETSGTTLTATTGGSTISVSGSVTLNQPGPAGTKAVTSAGGYLNAAYADILASTNSTLEFWFKIPVTGATGTNDTPTLYRRDGNGVAMLARYRKSTVTPGGSKFETYSAGRSRYSTASVNDGLWHHFVLVKSGTAVTEYLDGNSTTWWSTTSGSTSVAAQGTTNPISFLAENGGVEPFGGASISNIAIYNTVALSGARVTAHYNEAANGGYTAQVMTATGQSMNPTLSGVVESRNFNLNVNFVDAATGTISVPSGGGRQIYVDLTPMAGFKIKSTDKITFTFYNPNTTVAGTMWISDFEDGQTLGSKSNWTGLTYNSILIDAEDFNNYVDSGQWSGYLKGTQSFNAATQLSANESQKPKAAFTAVQQADKTFVASPMTASGIAVQPVISVVSNRIVVVNPMTGTAQAINPSVSAVRNSAVVAEAMVANGSMGNASVNGESIPNADISAQPMTAIGQMIESTVVAGNSVNVIVSDLGEGTGEMLDATFSSKTPVNINAQYMISIGRIITPKVNGFDIGYYDDPYYVLTQSQTDADDLWYRFAEETGAQVVKDEKVDLNGLQAANGVLYGTPTIGNSSIANHRSIYFDGLDDYIDVPLTADGAVNTRDGFFQGSTEFYIKTDGKNQPIMLSHGDLNMGQSTIAGLTRDAEISLVDGKVRLTNRVYRQANPNQDIIIFDGFRDIADGQWHQVAITNWWYEGTGISIYVDGKLDRRTSDRTMLVGRPDTIGRSGNAYFRGEMSDIVHRTFANYSKYFIEQAYYAFFGFNPIRPELMTANGDMGNARGRGNATKILALHHRFAPRLGGTAGPATSDIQGLDTQWANAPKVDQGVQISKYGNIYPPFAGTTSDINSSIAAFPGAKLYYQSVFYKKADYGNDLAWRDSVTDEPRAIDLLNDVDISDFDAIYLVDFPGVDYFKNQMQFRNAMEVYDEFLETIKKAVFDNGINLYLASPDAAKALGLVDEYEAKLIDWDSSPAQAGYTATTANNPLLVTKTDYRAAYNNPFVNPEALAGRESDLRVELARRLGNPRNAVESMINYYDTHRNNHHRFAVSVPEFTDISGYFLTETTWYRQDLQDYDKRAELSYRYLDRVQGARIGDEAIIAGPVGQDEDTYVTGGNPPQTKYNLISFRPIDINVGVAVTKESTWLDNGVSRMLNPTAENATIILIPGGSELDGRVIKGRIVINPNDNAAYAEEQMYTYFMDLEDNSWENVFKAKENDISKAWQWSTHRLTKGKVEIESTTTSVITGKNGANAVLVSSAKRSQLASGEAKTYVVRQVNTAERSWNWLIQPADIVEEGDVRVKAGALNANAMMPNASVGAVSNKAVAVTTALGTATLIRPLEDRDGANKVLALPMTATGSMIQPDRKISVGTMTATAEMIAPVGTEYDSEDIVYLKLQNVKSITFRRNGDI